MDGKFRIVVLVILFFCSCKNQDSIENIGKELITQEINILIDSIESFDMSKIKRPEKFKNIKIEKITIGLLDSVVIENSKNKIFTNFLKFKISKNEIRNFKSNYNINIIKINNYDSSVLFVRFLNVQINENEASIIVKKICGISMIKERFFFKKENGVWVFKKKEFLSMG